MRSLTSDFYFIIRNDSDAAGRQSTWAAYPTYCRSTVRYEIRQLSSSIFEYRALQPLVAEIGLILIHIYGDNHDNLDAH